MHHQRVDFASPGDNVKQVMEDFGLLKSQVDKEPKVQQLTKDFFNGKEPYRGINPDEAVALVLLCRQVS